MLTRLMITATAGAIVVAATPRYDTRTARSDARRTPPDWLRPGTPDIREASPITFSPDGLLLLGDSRGSAVFAIRVHERDRVLDTVRVRAIDERVAERLGTVASEIAIRGMAVHPTSHAVYLSVSRGLGAGARPAIVRVGPSGRVDLVPLARVEFAKASLPNPPAADAKDEDGDSAAGMAITDLAVADGVLFVAGLTNDAFSSTLRRVPLPFSGTIASTGIRVFHTHHGRFETRSPVTALAPYRAGGRDYLLVSYACTPLALIPVDSLADGAKVSGRTIAELGAGTHATSLVTYRWRDRQYLAVATIGRSLQLLEADSLFAAPGLGPADNASKGHALGSWYTWGVPAYTGGVSGVLRIADMDSSHVVALQRAVTTGTLYLRALQKPILWQPDTGS
jgi:hypothetical protein